MEYNILQGLKHIPIHTYLHYIYTCFHSCSSRDCYASFLSKDEYLVHQLAHKQAAGSITAEVFLCDFCKAVLPTKSKLYRHRMFHIGEKHFRCPIKVGIN